MGLPFRSGHILALRRFTASTVGPGSRSVWHREPDGRWTFYQDAPSELVCTRYFGALVASVRAAQISLHWSGPSEFSVTAAAGHRRLDWHVTLSSSAVTMAVNAASASIPQPAWRHQTFLAGMGAMAGTVLRAGKVNLAGVAPSRNRFVVHPRLVGLVSDSEATLDGQSLAAVGASPTAGRMRDIRISQMGLFAVGSALVDAPPTTHAALGKQ